MAVGDLLQTPCTDEVYSAPHAYWRIWCIYSNLRHISDINNNNNTPLLVGKELAAPSALQASIQLGPLTYC